MEQKNKLKLSSRLEFLKVLDAFSKISESIILEIKDNQLTAIAASEDNTLILHCESDIVVSGNNTTINIPDIKRLARVFESIDSTDLEMVVNSNNIEYKSNKLKFKYHLYEDGFLSKPAISIEKIKSFGFDVSFVMSKQVLQTIIKGSTFATDTNKVYLYTEDGNLKAELTDRARHNTDVYSLDLGTVDFELSPIPLNFDNVKLLNTIDDVIKVNINTKFSVVIFEIATQTTRLKYVATSLIQ